MNFVTRPYARTTDDMSTLTSNTHHRYKMGTEAMFTWLSDALGKTGITLDT